jgi:serine/threonine-protein kinase
VLVVRSILVPSTARMTLLFGILLGIATLISIYFIHLRGHDPSIFSATSDPRLRKPASEIAVIMTMVAGMWWLVATAIATAASHVIYGLREEVRDARRLGQYTLLEKLGEGGMGVVYLARHSMLRRPTAVKLLPPERFGVESVARFEREVQQTARLTHPNTIRIFDYGRTPDGIFYYAMEYLEGASLAEVVAEGGPMPAGRVIHVLDQAAGALTEAHGIGLIHRDIKPANIFLTQQGGIPDVAKVLDFGLVKEVSGADGDEATLPALTQANTFAGTPHYMAPEAIATPDKVDARTDIYSLGAVGYFLLTGKDVFSGRNVLEVCGHHLHTEPVPPSVRLGARIAGDLESLILSCLQKEAARRPRDSRELQNALRACRDASSWSEDDARRWLEGHAEPLRARQRRASVGSAATMEVDLGLRSGDTGHRKAG